MSSNCNSDGFAVDHDGHCLEDGVFSSTAPLAVTGEVLREIMSGSGRDTMGSHLDTDPLGAPRLSSSGGIPLEDVVIVEDGYSSDEHPPLDNQDLSSTSATIQAMLRSSKQEREALIVMRSKLQDVLCFLRKKGFSEAQIYDELATEGLVKKPVERNEFGLPFNSSKQGGSDEARMMFVDMPGNGSNPFIDKMKNKIDDDCPESRKDPKSPDVASGKSSENAQVPKEKPSWSSVVQNGGTEETLTFDYCPMPAGTTVITPSAEILKKGFEKFKLCLVGKFSKGTLPFSKVLDIAKKSWDSRGLSQVSQKDSHTFHFKFRSEVEMNSVLSRGTWYFERKPLILCAWGVEKDEGSPSSIPLWVKFKNLPDYYWTREGLSWVASSVGPPICADKTTSLLNPVPFAKMCVKYKVGDALPEKIKVAVMDLNSMELSKDEFVDVEVSYPQRPMICSGCNKLGHLVGACPTVKRVWVQKSAKTSSAAMNVPCENPTVEQEEVKAQKIDKEIVAENPVQNVSAKTVKLSSEPGKSGDGVEDTLDNSNQGEWTTVSGKRSGSTSFAPQGSISSQMPVYTALAKSLSKGQMKKARKAVGRNSPKSK